jgi:hypothetical protein
MKLELTAEEERELVTLLDEVLGDFSTEIADTDNAEFRRGLISRRGHIQAVRAKVAADLARDELVDEQGKASFPASDAPAH